MKKTIAMISALAISASLVMPFTAAAADEVQVTKLTSADSADFTDFDSMVTALGLKENATYPDAIAGEGADSGYVYLIYGYSRTNTNFSIAIYNNGTYRDRFTDSFNGVKGNIGSINFYYIGTSDTKTITQDKIPTDAATDVEYTVDPAYMVTIPANVTLKSNDVQTKTVTAENVKLEYGKEVVVKLTGASNTNAANKEGNKFHAVTKDGTSTATYTINEGTLGLDEGSNIVAAFPTFTDATQEADKKKEIKFSAASGATFAGEHSELLTFTLSVEASEQGGSQGESASDWKTASVDGVSLYVKDGATWAVIAEYAGNSGKIAVDEYNQIWINGSGLYDEAKDKTVSATDIYSENGQYSLYSV